MANDSKDGFISSHEPADNAYGQNGYSGASSDTPGKRTRQSFAPELDIAGSIKAVQADDWQTRKVDASPIAPAHGHRNVNANPVNVGPNLRPVTKGGPEA